MNIDHMQSETSGSPHRQTLIWKLIIQNVGNLVRFDPSLDDRPCRSEAVKYEIAILTYSSKVCWISGPHAGGKHDLTMFREGLKQKITPGKKVHADRGYKSKLADELMFSNPNNLDSKELQNFKSRSRLHLETLNGRLKIYECLNQTFQHGWEKQSLALKAVIATIHYHVDNGSELPKV
jgi:hypothetical protein